MVHIVEKDRTKKSAQLLIAQMRKNLWEAKNKCIVPQIQSYHGEILCEEFTIEKAKITVAAFYSANSIVFFLVRGWISKIKVQESIKRLHPLVNIEVSTIHNKKASMFPWTGGNISFGSFRPEEMEVLMVMQVVIFEYAQKRKNAKKKHMQKKQ